MKFINYLQSITGVGIFPLISLLVFVIFFILLSIYVLKTDKNRLNYIAALPIEEKEKEENKTRSR
ncbi:MAG: CcoQ/FixQ family Cbb3-type cytochrome c oxidase assembly chaperone [Bacteroidota bacterium]|nr:CcoQ/FixQ family Cbb3-type cytochrome c oxidase assembly chaperone [Bacteroidota bacterium]